MLASHTLDSSKGSIVLLIPLKIMKLRFRKKLSQVPYQFQCPLLTHCKDCIPAKVLRYQKVCCFKLWREVKVAQLCLTLCNPMDCSLPGSSVNGILQARILEWVAVPFSRGSSQPRDQTRVSHIAGGSLPSEPPGKLKTTGVGGQVSSTAGKFFTIWTTREAQEYWSG